MSNPRIALLERTNLASILHACPSVFLIQQIASSTLKALGQLQLNLFFWTLPISQPTCAARLHGNGAHAQGIDRASIYDFFGVVVASSITD